MSHRIYTTEALVLAAHARGEGSRALVLLTRDLGLIYGRAQGLRELCSKLRYSLQLFSLARVSLVRGREVWRVVNAEPRQSFALACGGAGQLSFLARVTALLVRLLRGETPQPELFLEFERGLVFMTDGDLRGEKLAAAERILVLRLLHRLGYIEEKTNLLPWLNFADWQAAVLEQSPSLVAETVAVINQALHHSHL